MVKIKYVVLTIVAAGIVILGIWGASYLSQSEEKKVKKQFYRLSEWVSKDSGETGLTMIQKVKNLGTLFDNPCEFKANIISYSGHYLPEEISGYVSRGRSTFSKLNLKFYDFNIDFPEKRVAKVTLTGRLTGNLATGEYVDEIRELECVLKKIENKWFFNYVEVVEVLKK